MDATLSSKNQITIPKEVREALHVSSGDKCRFFIELDGRVVILPVLPVTRLKGMFGKQKKVLTVEDMNRAVRKGQQAAYGRRVSER